jgi:hypothetical protein
MIAFAKPRCKKKATPHWHRHFLEMLPRIEQHARVSSLGLDPEARDEFIQAVICASVLAYEQLRKTGKSHLAFAGALARYGVAHVRAGRSVGTPLNSYDVLSVYAQQMRRIDVERLDRFDAEEDAWQEVAVEDKRSTPADIAALRIDFRTWLAELTPRHRTIAKSLAIGETTQSTAKKFRVSAGRVSQIRRELKNSWEEFQGQAAVANCA